MKDLLPEILQHLGPKQLGDLKDLLSGFGGAAKGEKAEEDDDIPQLETNFEEISNKVDWKREKKRVPLLLRSPQWSDCSLFTDEPSSYIPIDRCLHVCGPSCYRTLSRFPMIMQVIYLKLEWIECGINLVEPLSAVISYRNKRSCKALLTYINQNLSQISKRFSFLQSSTQRAHSNPFAYSSNFVFFFCFLASKVGWKMDS